MAAAVRPLGGDVVCRRIVHQLLFPASEQELDRLWPLLERLLAGTAFYLLQCNREPEAAQLAYESMRRKKFPASEQELDRLWPLLERLLAGTAFYLLQCNREPEAAQLAYESMRRKK